jgi:hypothetical protein
MHNGQPLVVVRMISNSCCLTWSVIGINTKCTVWIIKNHVYCLKNMFSSCYKHLISKPTTCCPCTDSLRNITGGNFLVYCGHLVSLQFNLHISKGVMYLNKYVSEVVKIIRSLNAKIENIVYIIYIYIYTVL